MLSSKGASRSKPATGNAGKPSRGTSSSSSRTSSARSSTASLSSSATGSRTSLSTRATSGTTSTMAAKMRNTQKSSSNNALHNSGPKSSQSSSKAVDTTPKTKDPILEILFRRNSVAVTDTEISQEDKIEHLASLTHIRMSHLALTTLPLPAYIHNCTHLYLSCNKLTELPSLACLKNLQFLALPDNKVCTLKSADISSLPVLSLLDVSRNQLKSTDQLDLPSSLEYIYVSGNPLCELDNGYRISIVCQVLDLVEIDDVAVSQKERRLARTLTGKLDDSNEIGGGNLEQTEETSIAGSPDVNEANAHHELDSTAVKETKVLNYDDDMEPKLSEPLTFSRQRLQDAVDGYKKKVQQMKISFMSERIESKLSSLK